MAQKNLKLAAFDFDNTIINFNSDTYINKLVNESKFKYPDEIEELTYTHGWTERMNAVFQFMFENHHVREKHIINCLKEIQIDSSMVSLFKVLKQNEFELIVISDANSIFIDTILEENRIANLFSKVFTNPAQFDEFGKIKVTPFNQIFNQNGDAFQCETQICARNMCKGRILKHYIETNASSSDSKANLIYVGDGTNDLCPGLHLKETDYYFVRKNFSLDKLLKRDPSLREKLASQVFHWDDAHNIIENLNLQNSL